MSKIPLAVLLLATFALPGCTTQVIGMRDPATGKIDTCGGTPLGWWERTSPLDRQCVASYEAKGFTREVYPPGRFGNGVPPDPGSFFPFH